MGKGNMLMGNFSGKLGDMVFFRANGEQRNRTYLRKIKNPRTIAQMTQRIKIASFTSAYRMFEPLVTKSFIYKKSNESMFNAFVSQNIRNFAYLQKDVTKQFISHGFAPIRPYQLTSGSLPRNFIVYNWYDDEFSTDVLESLDSSRLNVIWLGDNDQLGICIPPFLFYSYFYEHVKSATYPRIVRGNLGELIEWCLTKMSCQENSHVSIDVVLGKPINNIIMNSYLPSNVAMNRNIYLECFSEGFLSNVDFQMVKFTANGAILFESDASREPTLDIRMKVIDKNNWAVVLLEFGDLYNPTEMFVGFSSWFTLRGKFNQISTSSLILRNYAREESMLYQSQIAKDKAIGSYLLSSDGDGYVFKG